MFLIGENDVFHERRIIQSLVDDFDIRIYFLHFLLFCADIVTVSNMVCTECSVVDTF